MVYVDVSCWQKFKLAHKVNRFNCLQRRLKTNETTIIETNVGKVMGVKRKTIHGKYYYAFEGIPYAQPPLGELRFRAPQPVKPWNDVRNCTREAKSPMQKHFIKHKPYGNEDCLYLNIYTKQPQCVHAMPVMVWIYGGGFQVGEATRVVYAPDHFLQKDVLLVTLNYRLGALGFLSLSDPDLKVPGNAGLKDQVLALSWVKDNIARFGGDPNNVTIFGESAGAASVHLLMLSDKTNGLFHKAIIQSGTALAPWAETPQRNWAFRLAQKLGYSGSKDDKKVFSLLKQTDGKNIVKEDNNLLIKEELRERLFFAFGPCVEPYESDDSLLTRPFVEYLKTTWSNKIPIMIGYNSGEGLLARQFTIRQPWTLNELGNCVDLLPPPVKASAKDQEELEKLALRIKELHFGNKKPSFPDTMDEYIEILSCRSFWHDAHRTLLARQSYAPKTATYLYHFDVDSPFHNHFRLLTCGRAVRGVAHADELSYMWFNASSRILPTYTMEYKAISRMVNMWTSFATKGDPNCSATTCAKWLSTTDPCGCQRIANKPWKCLHIGEEIEFKEVPEWKMLQVWDSLFPKDKLY